MRGFSPGRLRLACVSPGNVEDLSRRIVECKGLPGNSCNFLLTLLTGPEHRRSERVPHSSPFSITDERIKRTILLRGRVDCCASQPFPVDRSTAKRPRFPDSQPSPGQTVHLSAPLAIVPSRRPFRDTKTAFATPQPELEDRVGARTVDSPVEAKRSIPPEQRRLAKNEYLGILEPRRGRGAKTAVETVSTKIIVESSRSLETRTKAKPIARTETPNDRFVSGSARVAG